VNGNGTEMTSERLKVTERLVVLRFVPVPHEFHQFVQAYEADWVTRDGRLVIDNPQVR
jgi:hypothetical protein